MATTSPHRVDFGHYSGSFDRRHKQQHQLLLYKDDRFYLGQAAVIKFRRWFIDEFDHNISGALNLWNQGMWTFGNVD